MNNGKICVSICSKSALEIADNARLALLSAIDFAEIRLDYLNDDQLLMILPETKQLFQHFGKRLLITFRPKEQGGERELSLSQRRRFWSSTRLNRLGGLFDIEADLQKKFPTLRYSPRIASYHNFTVSGENLENIYKNLVETGSEIIKVAIQVSDAMDGLRLMRLLETAKSENKELIPIAMGEHGIWTRILGLSRGAFMTFASLDDESATAPGQLTAQEMIDVYRVKELDENTEIYGLVAGSTAHSVSPEMHNASFKFYNLNAVYVPFAVKNLAEFIRRMVHPKTREIDWKLRGLSVTIPHKIEIMKYLDFVDEIALKIGAVNTVKIVGDELHGFNTDAAGFIEPLKNVFGDLKKAKVAVFGAGGAARAVIYALKNDGAEITVLARDLAKAESLSDDFGVEIKLIDDSQSPIMNYDILVNTTPLGMKKSGMENETPVMAEQLKNVKLVYDLVYNPFETRLLKEAQLVSVPTIGGLAMLVAQAVGQQKIWTGLDAPVKEMSQAALKKLSREN